MRLKITFMILAFLLFFSLTQAQEWEEAYTVNSNGTDNGVLRFRSSGFSYLEEAMRDLKGTTSLQEKLDKGSYSIDFLRDKSLVHVKGMIKGDQVRLEQTSAGKTVSQLFQVKEFLFFLSRKTPFDILLLKSKFPKKEGELLRFQVIDPDALESVAGAIENEGYRIISYNGDFVKARYFVAGIGNTGINLYQDSGGRIFLIETPLDQTSYHLNNYTPDSFPITNQDQSPLTPKNDFTDMDVPYGRFQLPNSRGPFPAALLISKSTPKNGTFSVPDPLEGMAAFLSNNRIAVLRLDTEKASESPNPVRQVAQNMRHAILWLCGQREVDPNRVFVVGYDEDGAAGILEAEEDPNLAALILIGEKDPLTEKDQTLGRLEKLKIPVLILQGGKDSPSMTEHAEQLFQAAKKAGNPSTKILVLPGLDHGLMKPTGLEGPAAYLSPERRTSMLALQSILQWLQDIGL